MVTPKHLQYQKLKMEEAIHSSHEHCAWHYLFMAQEKRIESIIDLLNSLIYKKKPEDRLNE